MILLIYPNSTKLPWFFKGVIEDNIKDTLPPLGMLSIISNSPYRIDFIDNRIKKYTDDELVEIGLNYRVVGFGGTIFEARQAVNVSQKLMGKGITTVYGGVNATVNCELYLNNFSCIVRGEAENWDWNRTDKVITLPRIEDLNILKFAERLNIDDYNRSELLSEKPVDTIVSSRGCPFSCTFCASKEIWKQKYIYRSALNVIKEIQWLKETYSTKAIYFREDNFTINLKRLGSICRHIDIPWMCQSRADLDEDTIIMMADSGCEAINFGIEATQQEDLDKLNKGLNIERIKKTVELCFKYRIKAIGMFIIGYPWDTVKSIKQRFSEAHKMGLYKIYFNRLFMFPKSEMYNHVKSTKLDEYEFDNIIIPGTNYHHALRINWVNYKLNHLNYKIKCLLGLGNIKI